jgi:phosphoserine aminotransferase
MKKVYNFSAGPAILPADVLKEVQNELINYEDSGMSVMEMSHRSKIYENIVAEAEKDLRELMNIPNNYKVLFLQGGAHLQFSMVPLNLMKNKKADYLVTGQWAEKAAKEAEKYLTVNVVASSKDKLFSYIPNLDEIKFSSDADYVHICENNTVFGTRFTKLPNTHGIPIVSDMSSCILSEPIDVSQYGIIYAGAQKNIGPAGTVVVIIREDLITKDHHPLTPTMLRYDIHAENGSMYNTPPTFGIYFCGKVFKWLLKNGGLEEMKKYNEKKAKILYDYLDQSKLFYGTVEKKDRSLMNVCFKMDSEELNQLFLKESKQAGFENLAGHRSVGGMRASIYNAMSIEGIQALVDFMKAFESKH